MTSTGYRPSYPSSMRLTVLAPRRPATIPRNAPHAICQTNPPASPGIEVVSGAVITPIIVTVRKTAMGSLLPDSNSSSERRRGCRRTLRERSTEKTAAASVDETIDPSSRACRNGRSVIAQANRPVSVAVRATPAVASTTPRPRTGRTSSHSVSRPPLYRMNANATTPRPCASGALSNGMPPGPSDPASIPTAMNSSSAGMPNRVNRLAKTLASSRTAAPSTKGRRAVVIRLPGIVPEQLRRAAGR